MSTVPVPNATVVPLMRGSSTWPPLVRSVWETLETALRPVFKTWGAACDDALFRRSEQGEDAQRYFEAMRLLRRVRGKLEADIQARYRAGLHQWVGQEFTNGGSHASGLALVENEQLEEDLAVEAMADRAMREGGPQWEALRRRLEKICQRESEENPLEPRYLARAVRQSLDAIDEFDTSVRLMLLKLFERHAWPVLASAVEEINLKLMKEGVLPNLQAPSARSSRPPVAPRSSESSHSSAGGSGERTQGLTDWDPAQVRELLGLLSQWQSSLAEGAQSQQGLMLPGPADVARVSPTVLRDRVLAQLPSRVRHADHEQAIDLVALVFEFLLKDDVIPAPVLATLIRLQLPYLRIAVLDPHGFAQGNHPARQLLDVLGQVGQTWSAAEDTTEKVLGRLRDTVDRLSEEDGTQIAVLETELKAWRAHLEQENRRLSRTSERTIAAQSGQERRQAAQFAVASAFVHRLGQVRLPANMLPLLQHWKMAMTLMHLRHGEDSQEFKGAVFLLDQVRALSQVHAGTPAAERLERMRASLHATLNKGWGLLDLAETARDEFHLILDTFIQEATGRLPVVERSQVGPPEPLPENLIKPSELLAQAAKEEVNTSLEPDSPKTPAREPLPLGTWVEFEKEGIKHRGKLSWISPFTHRWLMVSSTGLKIADLEPGEIDLQLNEGRAQIIPASGPVTRALASRAVPPKH